MTTRHVQYMSQQQWAAQHGVSRSDYRPARLYISHSEKALIVTELVFPPTDDAVLVCEAEWWECLGMSNRQEKRYGYGAREVEYKPDENDPDHWLGYVPFVERDGEA